MQIDAHIYLILEIQYFWCWLEAAAVPEVVIEFVQHFASAIADVDVVADPFVWLRLAHVAPPARLALSRFRML